MKTCSKCSETKDRSAFAKCSARKDGLQTCCKACQSAHSKVYRENPKVATKMRERAARWVKENPEAVKVKAARWRNSNRQAVKEINKLWSKNNKAICNANTAKRKAAKLQRTAPWSNPDAIRAIYQEAAELTIATGIQFHVDHIYPLQGEKVSGLHVETNLQVLPWYENLAKSNAYEIQ